MRVLIAGLGAIGQRHARNLRALRPDVELHAFRQRGLRHVVTESLRRDATRDVETELAVTPHATLDDALAARPDAVFICTPSALHLDVALRAAAAGCHLYIEKPVSHTIDGLGRLGALVAERKLVAMVGCQWRYHPCVRRLHELVTGSALGDLRKAKIEYAEYLPDWHPYEDYRTSYAARAELGGGVVLTHIHDYDLAWWLFGPVRHVHATGGHESDLEIDVEDTARAQLDTARGPVLVSQSFASRPPRRRVTIRGSVATAEADLIAGRLAVDPPVAEGVTLVDYQRNEMFRAAVADFLRAVEGGGPPGVPLADGVAVLRVALAVKESMRSRRPIVLT
ncbi:MAG: Gfo/Idh/MocA family oxidoreductase [Gemmatimonadota bacterium]|nr:Gfo/Idh/MocA family oxidoreductase [Gemmatimonadota bacterium]